MTLPNQMEKVPELGVIEQIPGAVATEGREVRYVQDRGDEPFAAFFKRLVRYVNPPLAKEGGVVLEGCALTVPTGELFQAISYRGDIDGWRQQVTRGAAALNVAIGQVVNGALTLSDGIAYRLADCQVTFE